MGIGDNIRKTRHRLSMTQQALADASGLSKGMISKIETGAVVPVMGTLSRIAEGLGVKFGALLEMEHKRDPLLTLNPFADPCQFITTQAGYRIFNPLDGATDKGMQPIMVYAKSGEAKPHVLTHPGEEFIFVVRGEMTFQVGDQKLFLRPGDSLYFDGMKKHGIYSVPNEVAYLDIFVGHRFSAGFEGGRGDA